MEVEKALGILRFSTRHSSRDLEKLLMSAIANWEAKNEGRKADEAKLVVKTVRWTKHVASSACCPHRKAAPTA
jgi:large subunit ribosomal protein L22